MTDLFRKMLGKKNKPKFSPEEFQHHDELKQLGFEKVLGKMYNLVNHAIAPFQIGGAVDMYFFPEAVNGTAFVTMELIQPDGSGPKPSRIGTYELIAFTNHKIGDEADKIAFNKIERHMCGIFTNLGHYSSQVILNPLETVEVPAGSNQPNSCLILDEYINPNVGFSIGSEKYGLLLVIEVFRREMEYAMKNGSQVVLDELKKRGYYPFSDLDREAVF